MRYFGLLLLLTLLVGCDPAAPITGPGASNTTDVDSADHTVNRPVVTDKTGPVVTDNAAPVTTDPLPSDTRKDNTAVNERDQNDAAKTPFDQGQDTPDIKLTADIRQKIVNHSGMSVNARNIKVISEDGKVTLRGPVASQEEKDQIDKFAKESAGADKVDNQLEIAP